MKHFPRGRTSAQNFFIPSILENIFFSIENNLRYLLDKGLTGAYSEEA